MEAKIKSLLIIDDAKLRRTAYQPILKIIKKMDEFERKIELFHLQDQKLFGAWFNLTFREEAKSIDELREQVARLTEFHNWMVALAHMEKIPMHWAYKRMHEEVDDYGRGDYKVRGRIESIRMARDEFIRNEIEETHRQQRESFERAEADRKFSNDDESRASDDDLDEDELQDREEKLAQWADYSEDDIQDLMFEPESAFQALGELVFHARHSEHFKVFLRFWALTPLPLQKQFAKIFKQATGDRLSDVINSMDLEVERFVREKKRSEENLEFSAEVTANDFARSLPTEAELLKNIYRRLVRKLHPDMQISRGVDSLSLWEKMTWLRVQDAYKNAELDTLEHIFKIVQLRSQDLKSLTLDEIHTSAGWLKSELRKMEDDSEAVKLHHAWGFSQRKSYEALTRKIRREFKMNEQHVQDELDQMQEQHRYLKRQVSFDADYESAEEGRARLQRNGKRPADKKTARKKSQAKFEF